MCVIIVKKAGQEVPSESFLKKAWHSNPDGAGFAYSDGENVHVVKGLMNLCDFFEAVEAVRKAVEDLKSLNMVFHFRIATHGAVEPLNTHPFKICDFEEKATKKLKFSTKRGVFFHNGILSNFGSKSKSDSFDFCDTILRGVQDFSNFEVHQMLENIASYNISRFAILTPGDVYTFGNFVEVNGYFCSNNYFNADYNANCKYFDDFEGDLNFENLKECDNCGCYCDKVFYKYGMNLCEYCVEDFDNYFEFEFEEEGRE